MSQFIILSVAVVIASLISVTDADHHPELYCTESGMMFTYFNQTEHAYINLLKLEAIDSNGIPRFRKRLPVVPPSADISACATFEQFPLSANLTITYNECAGDAISLVQEGDKIIRQAVVEVQPNLNALEPILRSLNYTCYKIRCEYTRQYNVTNTFNTSVTASVVKVDESDDAEFDLAMDFYDTPSFTVKSSSPIQVDLNEPMYVAVQKTWNDTNLKMVVDDCWATDTAVSANSEFKYMFVKKGCGLDPTYMTLLENANQFHFKLNAFVFLRLKSQTYLHCSVYVCEIGSTDPKCNLGCSGGRKRRAVEDVSNRERRETTDVATSAPALGAAISGQIRFLKKKTCSKLKCPSNSDCIENHPAYCRCRGNHVMNIYTESCTEDRLVQMNVPTKLTWVESYKDSKSAEFLNLAIVFEQKMLKYYVHENRVAGIAGLKIVTASQDTDALYLSVLMALTESATSAIVSSQIQNLLVTKTTEAETRMQVNPNSNIHTVCIKYETAAATNEAPGMGTEMNLILVAIVCLLVGLAAIVAFIRCKRNQDKEVVKVAPVENKAYVEYA